MAAAEAVKQTGEQPADGQNASTTDKSVQIELSGASQEKPSAKKERVPRKDKKAATAAKPRALVVPMTKSRTKVKPSADPVKEEPPLKTYVIKNVDPFDKEMPVAEQGRIVKVHPDDLYHIIGELTVENFDHTKVVKVSELDLIKRFMAPPKGDIKISPQPFEYDTDRKIVGVKQSQINRKEIPYRMRYEDEVAQLLSGRPYPVTRTQEDALLVDTAQYVMNIHYSSSVTGRPDVKQNLFEYRGNGTDIYGYNSSKLMESIKQNGVCIGYVEPTSRNFMQKLMGWSPKICDDRAAIDKKKHVTYVERKLGSKNGANTEDAYFVLAGYEYYQRRCAALLPGV